MRDHDRTCRRAQLDSFAGAPGILDGKGGAAPRRMRLRHDQDPWIQRSCCFTRIPTGRGGLLRYVDALEGKTDIVQIWRDTITESCRRNLDPAKCASGNLAYGSRSNAMEWIRLYVYSFGWNNCANKFMKVNVTKNEPVRSELERRFKRLFKTKRDETCH